MCFLLLNQLLHSSLDMLKSLSLHTQKYILTYKTLTLLLTLVQLPFSLHTSSFLFKLLTCALPPQHGAELLLKAANNHAFTLLTVLCSAGHCCQHIYSVNSLLPYNISSWFILSYSPPLIISFIQGYHFPFLPLFI